MRLRATPSLVLLILLAAACRDTTEAFEPDDRGAAPSDDDPIRLTFSAYDDRAPTWNAASDSVYYSGFSGDYHPSAPATILAIPREGGAARPALRNVQEGASRARWLFAPAVSPSGDRAAFLDLGLLRPEMPCPAMEVAFCPLKHLPSIRLADAVLRVRDIRAERALVEDPGLPLVYVGIVRDTIDAVPGYQTWATRYHPFQLDFIQSLDHPSRPSWSADERYVVTSDGLRLLIWEPETGAVEVVPGTQDGTAPAWSPDGDWIAYTFTERLDSTTVTCLLGEVISVDFEPDIGIPECFEHRTVYETAPPAIVLLRPDGSERQAVAEGKDPAWGPDGTLVFAAADGTGALRRLDPATGATSTLPGTEFAREPAVSPDGQFVAYSRPGLPGSTRDIYVSRLP